MNEIHHFLFQSDDWSNGMHLSHTHTPLPSFVECGAKWCETYIEYFEIIKYFLRLPTLLTAESLKSSK